MKSFFPFCDKLQTVSQEVFAFPQKMIIHKKLLIASAKIKKRHRLIVGKAMATTLSLCGNLLSSFAKNKKILINYVRFTAIALIACTALLCESGAAYNINKVGLSSVKIGQTYRRVSAYNDIKLTTIKPLPLSCFPSIFTSDSTKQNKSKAAVAPTEGNFAGDPFDSPQCTWYVWGRVKAISGVTLTFNSTSGRSARYWLNEVIETGSVTVVRNKKAIRAHSVAVFKHGGDGNGHVVVVENVIRDSLGNPNSIVFSESNWGEDKSPSQKQLSLNEFLSRSAGSLKGYIYF